MVAIGYRQADYFVFTLSLHHIYHSMRVRPGWPVSCSSFFGVIFLLAAIYIPALGQDRPSTEIVTLEKKLIEGKKYTILGDWEKAEAIFKAILQQDVQNSAACYELSRTLAASGRPEEALTYIRKAIRLEPDNEWYLLMEADIHEITGDIHEAMVIYDRLMVLRPGKAHYFEMQIQFCKKTGQQERLLQVLDQYEKWRGINETLTRTRFETLDALGRKQEALAAIHKLTEVFPHHIEYKFLAASYARKSGMEDRAIDYYQTILNEDPDNSRAKLALAGVQKESGDPASYLHSIMPVITNPALEMDVKLQELLPYVLDYSKSGNPALGKALQQLSGELVLTHPKDARAFALQGDILTIMGQQEQAIASYRQSTSLNSSVYIVWEQLTGLLLAERSYEELYRTAQLAIDHFPNQAYLYYAAGYALYKIRAFDQALDMLNEALIMTGRQIGHKISVYTVLGLVYDELGDFEKSSLAFETALGIDPKRTETLAYYSLVLSRRIARSEKGSEMTAKVLAQENMSPLIQEIMANVLYHQGKYNEAYTLTEKALASLPYGEVYDLAGDIRLKMGDAQGAVLLWQQAMEAGSTDDDIKRKIAAHKTQ